MLNDRVVVITGGTRGIGLATARAFARQGAQVAVGSTNAQAVTEVADELNCFGGVLDVRHRQSYADFLAATQRALGPIDLLVNNAGISHTGHLVDSDPGTHDLIIDVNLRGVLHGMEAVLPGMLSRRRGTIINISSLAARMPTAGIAVYSATKHALLGLSLAVRDELRDTGVRLTVILPTFVATDMIAGLQLRGLPQVSPETVARAIVRTAKARRPPAVVTVPRWLGPVPTLLGLIPQPVTDAIKRHVNADAATRVDSDQRITYQQRIKGL